MKTHWFSVLNAVGIVLLAGQVFGNELQWKKPGNSEPAESAVIRIPTVITTNDAAVPSAMSSPIRQVQAIQLPPRPATPSASQLDMQYPERRPQNVPVPTGATTQQVTPISQPLPQQVIASQSVQAQNIPVRVGEPVKVPCAEQVPLKSIREISHDIRPVTTGALPEECVMNSAPFDGRHFTQSCVHWKASAVCTKAAYFEDVQLERYGHTIVCPALQPIVSGAKFFATVPFLPYKMGVTPPNECVYTLGHYRTGNRSPYMVQPVPVSARGALFQAGAIVGGVAALP